MPATLANRMKALYDDRIKLGRLIEPRADASSLGEVGFYESSKILGPDGKPFKTRVSYPLMGNDGDDEIGYGYRRLHGRGGGAPGAKKDSSLIARLYASIGESIVEQYAPLHKPWSNAKKIIWNSIDYAIWKAVSEQTDEDSRWGRILRAISNTYKSKLDLAVKDISPVLRTVVAMSSGITDVERLYVYVDSKGEWPLYFSKFGDDKIPRPEQLDDAINHYKVNEDSILSDMEVDKSSSAMNRDFMNFHMPNYLGSQYHEKYFKDEMKLPLLWMFREDTKSRWAWQRDYAKESEIDAAYHGVVRVYRKAGSTDSAISGLARRFGDTRPKDTRLFWRYFRHDICQDIAGAIYAPILAALDAIGAPEQAQRHVARESFKFGSNLASTDFPFMYN